MQVQFLSQSVILLLNRLSYSANQPFHCQTQLFTKTNAITIATAITTTTVYATAFFVGMSHIIFINCLKHLPTAAVIWSGWNLVYITFNFFSLQKLNNKHPIPYSPYSQYYYLFLAKLSSTYHAFYYTNRSIKQKILFHIVPEKVKYLYLCHSGITLKAGLPLRVNFSLSAKFNNTLNDNTDLCRGEGGLVIFRNLVPRFCHSIMPAPSGMTFTPVECI